MEELLGLKEQHRDMIRQVRGLGLFNAIEFDRGFVESSGRTAWDFCLQLKSLGLLAKPTQEYSVRLAPPLVITEKQVLKAVSIIKKALSSK